MFSTSESDRNTDCALDFCLTIHSSKGHILNTNENSMSRLIYKYFIKGQIKVTLATSLSKSKHVIRREYSY